MGILGTFFKKAPGPDGADQDARSLAPETQPLEGSAPVQNGQGGEPEGAADRAEVDTDALPVRESVAAVLPVATHGERTSARALRQRILGRRPILDGEQRLVGYELALRTHAPPEDNPALAQMHDDLLLRSLATLPLVRLAKGMRTWVGLSLASLDHPALRILPQEGITLVLRVLAGEEGEAVSHIARLTAEGYAVALDDAPFDPGVMAGCLHQLAFVRLDLGRSDALALDQRIRALGARSATPLVVQGVDTDDGFEACRNLSFQWFQGYYFAQRQPAKPARIDSERMRVIELLNKVASRAEIKELEAQIKRDAALSYKLMRYINSPGCGLAQKVHSIGHALVALGYGPLYRWLTLLLFTSGQLDMRAQALLRDATVRGRLMETLGLQRLPPPEADGLFITGIFSLLDVLLNMPMEQALARISLPEPVAEALLRRQGPYAPLLALAVACGSDDRERTEEYAAACRLDAETVNAAHVDAMIWAEELEA
ncbi:MAG: HDOD domain-containing protein [Betaproteobacteria bacterium]|nr:HDOD domain-containing protein [Betaproteobacteria bacterium]